MFVTRNLVLAIFKTGNGERGTGNGERGTGNGERGTGNGERGTGNGERGTGYFCSHMFYVNFAAVPFVREYMPFSGLPFQFIYSHNFVSSSDVMTSLRHIFWPPSEYSVKGNYFIHKLWPIALYFATYLESCLQAFPIEQSP